MGEPRTRGLALGRIAALAFACAAVLDAQFAMAQARSPAGDKSGAQGLGGAVVTFEEGASRAILYHEAKGSLVNNNTAPPAALTNGSPAATPRDAASKAAPAKAPAAEAATTNGANSLRAPQRKAAPAEGVALRP